MSARPERTRAEDDQHQPEVATTSPSQQPAPVRSWAEIVDRGEVEHQVRQHRAEESARDLRGDERRRGPGVDQPRAPARPSVTTGLNAAETGCSARISATRAAPVTRLFSSSCRPTSSGRGGSRRSRSRSPPPPGMRCRRTPPLRAATARALTRRLPPIRAARSASASALDPVVHPHAALAPVQQPRLVQHLQVVADRRLGQVEGLVEVADAGLALPRGTPPGTATAGAPDPRSPSAAARSSSPAASDSGSCDQRRAAGNGLGRVRTPNS